MILSASVVAFASRPRAQISDVSHLVPDQISYARGFVQHLSDAGLSVQKVALSKYNGGFFGPTKAVWIKTDKGILEVVFFDTPADLDAIQLHGEESVDPNYHKYTITLVNKNESIEGRLPVWFTKYQDALIITYDSEFNKTLNLLLRR
jgi:hypothetical protein